MKWYISNVDEPEPWVVRTLAEARAILGVKSFRRFGRGCYVTTYSTTLDGIVRHREFWVCRLAAIKRLGFPLPKEQA